MDLRIERWHGQYGHGAMRDRKRMKREQAEARNALTKPEDRRQARLAAQKPSSRLTGLRRGSSGSATSGRATSGRARRSDALEVTTR